MSLLYYMSNIPLLFCMCTGRNKFFSVQVDRVSSGALFYRVPPPFFCVLCRPSLRPFMTVRVSFSQFFMHAPSKQADERLCLQLWSSVNKHAGLFSKSCLQNLLICRYLLFIHEVSSCTHFKLQLWSVFVQQAAYTAKSKQSCFISFLFFIFNEWELSLLSDKEVWSIDIKPHSD